MKLTIAVCTALLVAGSALAQNDKPKMPKMPEVPKQVEDAAKKAAEGMKKDDHAKPGEAPAGGASDAEMQAWMAAAKPGVQHEWMAKLAGEWTTEMKMFDPAMGESGGKGTMKVEMVMGGRFQHSFYKGEFMGAPFEGSGLMGYDNVTKKYQSTWADNMSTMMMMSTGDYNKDTQELTMTSEFTDPTTMKKIASREVSKFIDNNRWTMSFFHTKEGKEEKVMEINYTRKGAAAATPATPATPAKDQSAVEKAKEEAIRKAKEAAEKAKQQMPGNR
jgi:hypothetical protein